MTRPLIQASLTLSLYVAALAVWFLQFGVAGAFP